MPSDAGKKRGSILSQPMCLLVSTVGRQRVARLPARDVQAASRLAARGNYQAFARAYGAVGKPHALHTARQLGR